MPNPYIRNLKNTRKFTTGRPKEPRISQDEGEIWGGAFWEMRERAGKEATDKVLFVAWGGSWKNDPRGVEFARHLVAVARSQQGEDLARSVKDVFLARGLDIDA
jgi:hypothetical protein